MRLMKVILPRMIGIHQPTSSVSVRIKWFEAVQIKKLKWSSKTDKLIMEEVFEI